MNAKDLIQSFKDTLDVQSSIAETDTRVSPPVGDRHACRTRVVIPIEGSFRVYEIEAREIVDHRGLAN